MKRPYLFGFILLLLIMSCSTSDDSEMLSEENMEMEEMSSVEVAYSGNFISSAHPTSGKVTIDKDKKIVSFTNFKTDSGPGLEVYLATDTSASSYISLGALKGIEGNYEYNLPDNIDYNQYNHVIIWCVPFSVNFGYAVLN
ncbi:DM13 domain-containing protein [Aestuariibaculum lutulentum]|uniref:DM13 domain-containing protein n=1 Tax=Aestuariibaculum lutulentum TaxID=2920935 RepID=A0ABS9RKM7_9FLAO|nr:DM13 domain-containing protein [Aestuariibaculum lutulentum]MCH4553502.1 DM13 domain-containing protein [Aestuariibaculum lutulentum]